MRQPIDWQKFRAAASCLAALLALIPSLARAAGEWTPAGPDGGTIHALAIGPDAGTLFVGTRAGVYRSTDAGAHWTAANGGLPLSDTTGGLWVQALAVDAGPPETVYASLLLQGVFRSVDGGATWHPANNGLVGTHAEQLVVHAGHAGTVYALTSAGIFRTTNGGAQWTKLPAFPTTAPNGATTIAVDPLASQTIYAGLPDQLLRTVDGGQAWVRIDGPGFRGWYIDEIAVDPADPGTLYVAAADFGAAATGLFRSADGGATWTSASAGLPSGKRALALTIAPAASGALFVAPLGAGVFTSLDGGAHWSALDGGVAHASALAVDPTESETLFAVGAPAGAGANISTAVFRTGDGGESWELRSDGINAHELEAVVIDPKTPSTLYLRSFHQGILKSTDAGQSWQPINQGLGGPAALGVQMLAIDPVDPRVLYASIYGRGYFKTVDAGLHWAPIASPAGADYSSFSTLYVDPGDPRILITATGEGIFRSIDAGQSWSRLPGAIGLLGQGGGDVFFLDLVREPAAPQVLYAAAGEEIIGSPPRFEAMLWKSLDRGATWSVVDNDFPYALAIAPGPPSVLFAYGLNEILASTDGGAHWTRVGTTPKPIFRLLVDPRSTQVLYAATFTGVLRSDDGGATWRTWDEGLTNVAVTDLAFDPQNPSRLFVATRGGGLSIRLAATVPCVPSAAALCLEHGRFRVSVSWRDHSGRTGTGTTLEFTPDTGAFWFFRPANLELTVKVLDGRAVNNRFWVFYGSLTNVEFTLTVTDTETGRQRVYHNPSGRFASAGDTDAF